jgi:hypothetical protein
MAKTNAELDQERIDRQTAESPDRNAETRALLMASRRRQGLHIPDTKGK